MAWLVLPVHNTGSSVATVALAVFMVWVKGVVVTANAPAKSLLPGGKGVGVGVKVGVAVGGVPIWVGWEAPAG